MRKTILVVLALVVACGGSSEPSGPSVGEQLTVGSYTLRYQDTGFSGQAFPSAYVGTMEVLAIAPMDSVLISFDVERENQELTDLHFEVGPEGHSFNVDAFFLMVTIRDGGCGTLGCLAGLRFIRLATVADEDDNFCISGTDPVGVLNGDPFPGAFTCTIEKAG